MEAFWDLHTERAVGAAGVPGPIPHSRTVAYAAGYVGLDGDMTRLFARIMRLMDAVYLDWAAEQARRRDGGDGARPSRSGRRAGKATGRAPRSK